MKKLLLLLAGWELGTAALRLMDRKRIFAEAQARAAELGRPLVVVGDPFGGGFTRLFPAYTCGDLCVDLNGCPKCPEQLAADITKDKLPLCDDSAVVFVSCVLEYVDDIQAAWRELRRVAGPELYLVRVGGWSLSSWLFPGAKWILSQVPEGGILAQRISDDPRDGSSLAEYLE